MGEIEEVTNIGRSLMPRVHLVAFLDTLYYLAKGGRVPQIAAWANSLLRIKPFFELPPLGVEPKPIGKVRTRPRAVERLLQHIVERTTSKPINCIVMHAHVLDEAERLKSSIASKLNYVEISIKDFTPVMGVHTGPGLLGAAFHTIDADVFYLTENHVPTN